jgi:c-di-GMP-binding flagellar brake protein YcgR
MAAAGPTDAAISLLQEACARNTQVEIHQQDQRSRHVARSRLLALENEKVYVDRTQNRSGEVDFTPGKIVECFFTLNDRIYAFITHAVQRGALIELNREKRVVGAVLGTPAAVDERQRRNAFRVSLAGTDPILVSLHACSDTQPFVAPLSCRPFACRAVNISLGGFALSVAKERCPPLREGQFFFAGMPLPECPEPLLFVTQLRYRRPVPDSGIHVLGFRIIEWDMPWMPRQIDDMGRFIIELQRRKLRKR